jgi:DNA-binding transcriptional regulator YiaG
MGLSQTQLAMNFGLSPGTLRNWEQERANPDAPTRVLLAVIAKHPEAPSKMRYTKQLIVLCSTLTPANPL